MKEEMNTNLASTEPTIAADATSPMPYPAQQSFATSGAVNDSSWRRWPGVLRGTVTRVQHWMRALGPYVAIELLLPGGTLIALALWTYRRLRAGRISPVASATAVVPAQRRASLRCVAPCGQT